MRRCLKENNQILISNKKVIKFDYNLYIEACEKIANDIKNKYQDL